MNKSLFVVIIILIVLYLYNILRKFTYYKESKTVKSSFYKWLNNPNSSNEPSNAVFRDLFHYCFPHSKEPKREEKDLMDLNENPDYGAYYGTVNIVKDFPYLSKYPQNVPHIANETDVMDCERHLVNSIYDECELKFKKSYNPVFIFDSIPSSVIEIAIHILKMKYKKNVKIIESILNWKKEIFIIIDAIIILILIILSCI